MDLGFWLFVAAMVIIALGLWDKKRRGSRTVIDERGTPQMRLDEARRKTEENDEDGP